ncbi:predicted phosphohydrolase [Paenibacillus popilliae ATCC 14706]|uniref:Predicted phosphohydrolase n=1 Tax=Paenibacillus popilliae ATCC 14706 TaxID=1212764 RepID=M9LQB5_PAEPP|nr:predicted phosphohydrolase [Paenibacillus popilliae ATCC 14706]
MGEEEKLFCNDAPQKYKTAKYDEEKTLYSSYFSNDGNQSICSFFWHSVCRYKRRLYYHGTIHK